MVGEHNRTFVMVPPQQIAVDLSPRGYNINRRDIELNDDIRFVGAYTASIDLGHGVSATLDIQVIPESG